MVTIFTMQDSNAFNNNPEKDISGLIREIYNDIDQVASAKSKYRWMNYDFRLEVLLNEPISDKMPGNESFPDEKEYFAALKRYNNAAGKLNELDLPKVKLSFFERIIASLPILPAFIGGSFAGYLLFPYYAPSSTIAGMLVGAVAGTYFEVKITNKIMNSKKEKILYNKQEVREFIDAVNNLPYLSKMIPLYIKNEEPSNALKLETFSDLVRIQYAKRTAERLAEKYGP